MRGPVLDQLAACWTCKGCDCLRSEAAGFVCTHERLPMTAVRGELNRDHATANLGAPPVPVAWCPELLRNRAMLN